MGLQSTLRRIGRHILLALWLGVPLLPLSKRYFALEFRG